MNDNKEQTNHDQYEELQQLLKNLGITRKRVSINKEDKRKADEVFPE